MISHEGVSGVHMMSPPPQAIEPIEPSSTATADILLKQHKTTSHILSTNINVQNVNNILCICVNVNENENVPKTLYNTYICIMIKLILSTCTCTVK